MRSANVLAPVEPGRELDLDARLHALRHDDFAELAAVHFARLVVIGQSPLVRTRNPLRMKYLLLSIAFDGATEAMLESLRCGLAQTADDVWGHCVRYPSWRDRAAFHAWFRVGMLPVRARFAEWPDLSPAEVRDVLRLRHRHVELAERLQGCSDADVRAGFVEEFGP